MAISNIQGQRFGRLVALEFSHVNQRHKAFWRFQCDCGNTVVLPADKVKLGHTKSCGCLRRERAGKLKALDITGQRFGRLVAQAPTDRRDAGGSVVWQCRCDCGNTALYSVNELRRSGVQSCGCLYRESRPNCVSARRDMVDSTSLGALVAAKGLRANNTSGCTGVYHHKQTGKWWAYIDCRRKRYFLGVFDDMEAAVQARKQAEQRLHDPAIGENWPRLTPASQARFRAYLAGEG